MCGVFIGVLRSWHGGCRSRCWAWLARPDPYVDAARTCTKGSALALMLTSTIPRGGTLSAPSTAPPVTTFRWPVPGMAISPRRRADRHRQPASVCPPGRLRTLPVHRLPPEWGVAPEDRDAGGDRVHPAHAPPRAPTRLPPHPLVRLPRQSRPAAEAGRVSAVATHPAAATTGRAGRPGRHRLQGSALPFRGAATLVRPLLRHRRTWTAAGAPSSWAGRRSLAAESPSTASTATDAGGSGGRRRSRSGSRCRRRTPT